MPADRLPFGLEPRAKDWGSIGFRGRIAVGLSRYRTSRTRRGSPPWGDLAGDRIEDLVAELVAATTERIEQAVADRKFDHERADEILTGTDYRVIVPVNGKHSACRGGLIVRHWGIHRLTS